MTKTQWLGSLAVTVLAAACGGSSPATNDAGGGGNDAGGGGDVAACQAAVDAVISACNAEGNPPADRLCLYAAYRELCARGRPTVITAMMSCLQMDACQSAADPSAAASCVQGVVSANQNAAHMALGAAVCGCETTPETGCPTYPQYSGAELIMGSDADVQTVTTCLSAATTCDMAAATACYDMIPFGHAFNTCFGN